MIVEAQKLVTSLEAHRLRKNVSRFAQEILVPGAPLAQQLITVKLASVTTHCKEMATLVATKVSFPRTN